MILRVALLVVSLNFLFACDTIKRFRSPPAVESPPVVRVEPSPIPPRRERVEPPLVEPPQAEPPQVNKPVVSSPIKKKHEEPVQKESPEVGSSEPLDCDQEPERCDSGLVPAVE